MTALWHYTCDHGREALGEAGTLLPLRALLEAGTHGQGGEAARTLAALGHLAPSFVRYCWATDLDHPVPDALGLTSAVLSCDRTRHRYRVEHPDADMVPWLELRRYNDPTYVTMLETEAGAMPRHWWVSTTGVPVVHDPMT